ncbi:MAG: hypothetical protein ABIN97_12900 [Ginsengibacter sp.]
MLKFQKIFLTIALLVISNWLKAQEFGGNPPSVKWQQVNTPTSRIIFPVGMQSEAIRVANIISYLNNSTQQSIGNRQHKINVVLQNQTTISNGYVGLGPFRSEFFLTPLQNSFQLGSLPWVDQLAIHEFRHVQQYNNYNIGISKLMRILFGEEGQALANNAAIPDWFFEGDAVYNETNVSSQGRGRLPFFFNAYRSLWQSNKNYSWMKLRNGSYKDFIPDHYALGYLLVAYGREKYGNEFWKNVTHDAAAFKGIFYPFQIAIKKYSGKNFIEFRNDALQFFRNNLTNTTVQKNIRKHKNENYISYEYPSYTESKAIVFVKSSYKYPPAFYIFEDNRERKIRTKDASIDNYFSYRNGKIVYTSYRPDKRWGYKDYGELQILDVTNGRQQTLTKQSKYFSPDISEDGKRIVVVEVEPKGESSLQILNADNGKVISKVPNTDSLFYTFPKFYGADKIISAVRDQSGRMSLAQISINSGVAEYLLPFSFNVIGFPTIWHDTVYFSASYKKDDKLFAYSIENKKLLTPESFLDGEALGYYQPSITDNKIAWTTFTANGFKLVEKDRGILKWKDADTTYFHDIIFDFMITSLNKNNANALGLIPQTPLSFSKYSKATGLLNFHSIEPAVNDPEYSITLVSENILNTLQSQLSFTYNNDEQFKKIGFNGVYSGLFPYLSAGVDYTIDRRGRYHGQRVYWNEVEPGAGISLPLNLSKGRSLTNMNIGTRYTFNQTNYKGAYKDTLGKVSYSYLNNFFSFTTQELKGKQQIYPAFAQALSISFKKAVTNYTASQFVVNANFYLPGLFGNQSIVLNGAYLKRSKFNQINFSSNFPFSRGYESENLYQMAKWGINYHFPLFYPDKGFANIVYLLRTRANLFYDQTHVNDFFSNGSIFKADLRSTGAEVYFDTKWWNELPLTLGIRYSHLLDDDLFGQPGKNRWELILPVNLLQQ